MGGALSNTGKSASFPAFIHPFFRMIPFIRLFADIRAVYALDREGFVVIAVGNALVFAVHGVHSCGFALLERQVIE